MFNLLGPREVTDMYKTVNSLFKFYENTEVCKVADSSCAFCTYWIFLSYCSPRIRLKLFDAERHLSLVSVKCQYNCLNLISYLKEILSAAQVE
ncbi:hypothetical protein SDC9_204510 [bioreactor metagenome]|uniref:Uncharacterized protein n=1 Tax=bioreactor metagenome TaxID=1076179 RepID=A0A645J091_9ZZZZ